MKKLRYYARFIVVCLLLNKMDVVKELVKVSKCGVAAVQLYFVQIGPCLEGSIQSWALDLKEDIDTLEWVQRRAVKLIKGLETKS